MSIQVTLDELPSRIKEYGSLAFLVTVGDDHRAHVVSVRVMVEGDGSLIVGAGRRTRANVTERPDVTLVWPPDGEGRFSLIVDGAARAVADPEAPIAIRPGRGVLHALAEHS